MSKKYLLPIISTIIGIASCIYRIFTYDVKLPDILIMVCLFILIWMVHFLKLFKMPFGLEIIYDIFLTLAISLGSIMKLYDRFSWWDILCHTYWGYIGCYLGLIFLCKFKYYHLTPVLFAFFCFITSMACASLWECFEFTADRIFSLNFQHWEDTGVFDTMYDILCNLTGACIFIIHYIIDYFCFKKNFIGNIINALKPLSLNVSNKEEENNEKI